MILWSKRNVARLQWGNAVSCDQTPHKKNSYFPLIQLLYHLQTLETSELLSSTWLLSLPLLTILTEGFLTKPLLTKISST